MHVVYLPIEPYKERYTELLERWTHNAWAPLGKLTTIRGASPADNGLSSSIDTGVVLDAYSRSFYALSQMSMLVKFMHDTIADQLEPIDAIYFDDMFTPGYEALPYILDQIPFNQRDKYPRPLIFVRNHAQSMDVYDFTSSMRSWMRHYEYLVANTATTIIVASWAHAELMSACNFPPTVRIVGLPFDMEDVRAIRQDYESETTIVPYYRREQRVVFNSRWDAEKQPHFLMDVIEDINDPTINFTVCTGARDLRSNDQSTINRALDLEKHGMLHIATNLTKGAYYSLISRARVHFNCALQDFVSYGVLEASTLGTPTVAPAFRSFIEVFKKSPRQLYIPWSVGSASDRINELLMSDVSDALDNEQIMAPAWYHHYTLMRIWTIMREEVEERDS